MKGITRENIQISQNSKVFADFMAKAVTAYAFRAGPVEDIHADGRISEEEMKQLNKYMVERLGEIFYLFAEGRLDDLEMLLSIPYQSTSGWDDVTLDDLESMLALLKSYYRRKK